MAEVTFPCTSHSHPALPGRAAGENKDGKKLKKSATGDERTRGCYLDEGLRVEELTRQSAGAPTQLEFDQALI